MKGIYIDSCNTNLLVMAINGDKVDSIVDSGHGLKHNSILLPSLDKVLDNVGMDISEVEYVGCNVGPGSFTGIRLGVTTANGLAFSTGAKRVAMNAFEELAYNKKCKLLVLIDARHGNYYGAEYADGKCIHLGNYTEEDKVSFDGEVLVSDDTHYVDNVRALFEQKVANGDFVDMLAPMYLKLSQAEREENERNQAK